MQLVFVLTAESGMVAFTSMPSHGNHNFSADLLIE